MTETIRISAAVEAKVERPVNVRIALPSDEDAIFDLLTGPGGLYEENALFPLSKRKVRNTIHYGCAQHNGQIGKPGGPQGIIGVIEHEGKIVGTVGMGFSEFWYTETMHLSEYWNFVHPDFRKTDYANDLIDFAKWCSQRLNLLLHMGIISTHRVKGKVRLYQRKMRYMGGYFMFGLSEEKLKEIGGV